MRVLQEENQSVPEDKCFYSTCSSLFELLFGWKYPTGLVISSGQRAKVQRYKAPWSGSYLKGGGGTAYLSFWHLNSMATAQVARNFGRRMILDRSVNDLSSRKL